MKGDRAKHPVAKPKASIAPLRWRGSASASRRAAAPAIQLGGDGFDADEAIARLLAARRDVLESEERGG